MYTINTTTGAATQITPSNDANQPGDEEINLVGTDQNTGFGFASPACGRDPHPRR